VGFQDSDEEEPVTAASVEEEVVGEMVAIDLAGYVKLILSV
jgi:hypothetical protein